MYRWEPDTLAQQQFDTLPTHVKAALSSFMDAVIIADPTEYQRRPDEMSDPPKPLRSLHFGRHDEGLVTFLVYPPDDLVLIVRIQWLGD